MKNKMIFIIQLLILNKIKKMKLIIDYNILYILILFVYLYIIFII